MDIHDFTGTCSIGMFSPATDERMYNKIPEISICNPMLKYGLNSFAWRLVYKVPNAQHMDATKEIIIPKRKLASKKSLRCSKKITQIPPKPSNNPISTLLGTLGFMLKKPIITSHNGKIAAMIAPRPPEIYLTPSVVKPFVRNKFSALRIRILIHSFPRGHLFPLNRK